MLTDLQIERYSRQIILPRIGGLGQERLLAARIALAGDLRDIEAPLAYLAGAGAGSIELCVSDALAGAAGNMAAEMRALNPDCIVIAGGAKRKVDLALAIIGSAGAHKLALELVDSRRSNAFVVARLDAPGMIAVLPGRSPCPRCAWPALLADYGTRAGNADFVAMAATAEAFKLAAGYAGNAAPALVEFKGYETSAEPALANGAPRPSPG